jgi:hypothetical protein
MSPGLLLASKGNRVAMNVTLSRPRVTPAGFIAPFGERWLREIKQDGLPRHRAQGAEPMCRGAPN